MAVYGHPAPFVGACADRARDARFQISQHLPDTAGRAPKRGRLEHVDGAALGEVLLMHPDDVPVGIAHAPPGSAFAGHQQRQADPLIDPEDGVIISGAPPAFGARGPEGDEARNRPVGVGAQPGPVRVVVVDPGRVRDRGRKQKQSARRGERGKSPEAHAPTFPLDQALREGEIMRRRRERRLNGAVKLMLRTRTLEPGAAWFMQAECPPRSSRSSSPAACPTPLRPGCANCSTPNSMSRTNRSRPRTWLPPPPAPTCSFLPSPTVSTAAFFPEPASSFA